MAKLSTDDLLDAFKEMTLIELSEFVKKFEETFEVTAAAPVAVGAPAGGRRRRRRPRPPRSRTSSTSSSRPPATRRSRSSRRCARSRRSASRRPRTSSTAPPSRSWRRSTRTPRRRPRLPSRAPAPPSPSSDLAPRRRRTRHGTTCTTAIGAAGSAAARSRPAGACRCRQRRRRVLARRSRSVRAPRCVRRGRGAARHAATDGRVVLTHRRRRVILDGGLTGSRRDVSEAALSGGSQYRLQRPRRCPVRPARGPRGPGRHSWCRLDISCARTGSLPLCACPVLSPWISRGASRRAPVTPAGPWKDPSWPPRAPRPLLVPPPARPPAVSLSPRSASHWRSRTSSLCRPTASTGSSATPSGRRRVEAALDERPAGRPDHLRSGGDLRGDLPDRGLLGIHVPVVPGPPVRAAQVLDRRVQGAGHDLLGPALRDGRVHEHHHR